MNHVVRMPRRPSSASSRRAPTTPNSPRDSAVGLVSSRKIQDETASKSNVRQTRWAVAMALSRLRAAPHVERLPADEARLLAAEERDRVGDVGRLAHAAYRR